jgi:hypothetical protein
VSQSIESHGHRLGVSEQKGSVDHEQDDRKRDRADRVDMLERVERDAPELRGGVVSESLGDITVGSLVQRNRE